MNKVSFLFISAIFMLYLTSCELHARASINENILKHLSIHKFISNIFGKTHAIKEEVGPFKLKTLHFNQINENGKIHLIHDTIDDIEIIFEDYSINGSFDFGVLFDNNFNLEFEVVYSLYIKLNYNSNLPTLSVAKLDTKGIKISDKEVSRLSKFFFNSVLEKFELIIRKQINQILVGLKGKVNAQLNDLLNFKLDLPLINDKKAKFSIDKVKQFTDSRNWIIGINSNTGIPSEKQTAISLHFPWKAYEKLTCVYADSDLLVGLANYIIPNPMTFNKLEAEIIVKEVTFKEDESVDIFFEFELKTKSNKVKKDGHLILKPTIDSEVIHFNIYFEGLNNVVKTILSQAKAEYKS